MCSLPIKGMLVVVVLVVVKDMEDTVEELGYVMAAMAVGRQTGSTVAMGAGVGWMATAAMEAVVLVTVATLTRVVEIAMIVVRVVAVLVMKRVALEVVVAVCM